MRFVRAYIGKTSGELRHLAEHECPFERDNFVHGDSSEELVEVDYGLVEHFEPTTLDGKPCSPARHLFLRMEHDGKGGIRAKAGHTLPQLHDCPASLKAIEARLADKGRPLHPRALAWLALMLPEEKAAALGLHDAADHLDLLLELDAMRTARDRHVGSRAAVLKRRALERAAPGQAPAIVGLETAPAPSASKE